MSETTFVVKLSEGVAREIERLAREWNITPSQFLASAAAAKVNAIASAADCFAKRGEGADWEAFDRILKREGGEPPRPGDAIE